MFAVYESFDHQRRSEYLFGHHDHRPPHAGLLTISVASEEKDDTLYYIWFSNFYGKLKYSRWGPS